jgi:hypothetical protein
MFGNQEDVLFGRLLKQFLLALNVHLDGIWQLFDACSDTQL